jgi:hypothetical protein
MHVDASARVNSAANTMRTMTALDTLDLIISRILTVISKYLLNEFDPGAQAQAHYSDY